MLKRVAGILGMLVMTGCGSSSSSTAPSANVGTFHGTFTGSGGQVGTLTVTTTGVAAIERPVQRFAVIERARAAFFPVVSAAVSTATGSAQVMGGSTTSLSGTYDSSSQALSLTGGGFSFTGNITSDGIAGTYTSSSDSGSFSALSSTAGAVTTYCGTHGRMGLTIQISADGKVSGQTSTSSCIIRGQVSGNQILFRCL